MLPWKKVLLLVLLLSGLLTGQIKAQTDSTRTEKIPAIQIEQPDLKLGQEKKRQKKTEKIAFFSCLFIVLTTVLLYNARSR